MRKTVKQQRNTLSLWQLLTITDCQGISLTSVLVVGGHGTVSWDYDSDILCTRQFVCSFVTNNVVAASHCVLFAIYLQILEKVKLSTAWYQLFDLLMTMWF